MIRICLIFALALVTACSSSRNHKTEEVIFFKGWVLSRCLSFIATNDIDKKDAEISASAYLEKLSMPLDQLLYAEEATKEHLKKDYRGSIPGQFNTMKCIDFYHSSDLDALARKHLTQK